MDEVVSEPEPPSAQFSHPIEKDRLRNVVDDRMEFTSYRKGSFSRLLPKHLTQSPFWKPY